MTAPSAHHGFRKFMSLAMNALCVLCALLVILPLVVILFYLVKKGASSLNLAFFTSLPHAPNAPRAGMANAIVGSLELLLLASVVGVPIGVLGGIYLAEYGGERINRWIRFWADVLNGVPSIVWGMLAYALLVLPIAEPFPGSVVSADPIQHTVTVQNVAGVRQEFRLNETERLESLQPGAKVIVRYHREGIGVLRADRISRSGPVNRLVLALIRFHNSISGFSALAGGLALGFIMVPLVLRTTEEVLVLVPRSYREAALALGLPQWKTIARIVLPTARRGIITGILLAMGRVAGETAPLLFTAFGNDYWNHDLSKPIGALPLQIFKYAISPFDDWHRQAWAGALVLVSLTLCLSAGVRFFSRSRLPKSA